MNGGAYQEAARALALLPREAREAAIAEALRRAYRTGADAPDAIAAPDAPGVRALLDRLRARISESVAAGGGGSVVLDQSALACPGQPWHAAVDGEPVLDGRYAMAVPDAQVMALVGSGWLEPVAGRVTRLAPTPRGAEALGAAPPPRVRAPVPRGGHLAAMPRRERQTRIR